MLIFKNASEPEEGYAVGCIIAMMIYIFFGIKGAHFFTGLGLAVIALTLLGLYQFREIFWPWMAVLGGDALLGAAFYLKFCRK